MTLEQLQNDVRDYIQAHAWFAGLPVVVEAAGDLEQELEQALNELGLSLVVATPTSHRSDPGNRAYLTVELVVAIAETPLTNQTGKTTIQALDRLIPHLHRAPLGEGKPLSFLRHETEDIPGMAALRVHFEVGIVYTS